MFFEEPYVRFAEILEYTAINDFYVKAYDSRIFYTISNRIETIYINDVMYKVMPASLIYIPPDVPYRFIHMDIIKMMVLTFDFTLNGKELLHTTPCPVNEFNSAKVTDYPYLDIFHEPIVIESMYEVMNDLSIICRERELKQVGYAERMQSLLKSVLITIARSKLYETSEQSQIVQRVRDYIHNNYTDELSGLRIKEIFNYHPYYVNRIFKSYTGETIHYYLMRHRIHTACQLIKYNTLSFEDISVKVGFKTQSHFSQCFKRFTKVTPSHYRKNVKNHII